MWLWHLLLQRSMDHKNWSFTQDIRIHLEVPWHGKETPVGWNLFTRPIARYSSLDLHLTPPQLTSTWGDRLRALKILLPAPAPKGALAGIAEARILCILMAAPQLQLSPEGHTATVTFPQSKRCTDVGCGDSGNFQLQIKLWFNGKVIREILTFNSEIKVNESTIDCPWNEQ